MDSPIAIALYLDTLEHSLRILCDTQDACDAMQAAAVWDRNFGFQVLRWSGPAVNTWQGGFA